MEKYSFLNFQRVSEKENRWKAKGEFNFEVFDGELKEEVVFNGYWTFKMKQAKNGRIIVKESDCGVIGSFPEVSFAVDYINFLNMKLTRDFVERLKEGK